LPGLEAEILPPCINTAVPYEESIRVSPRLSLAIDFYNRGEMDAEITIRNFCISNEDITGSH